jgi:methyl coenzyme M reductase alpha subunit
MKENIETLQAKGINPGYVEVTLDGTKVDRVIAFDEAEGYVLRYKLDATGQAAVADDAFAEERLVGQVEAWLLWAPATPTRDMEWRHALPKPASRQRIRLRSIIQ